MSPLRYRLSLIKRALFSDNETFYEVLVHHKANLPNKDVMVAWERDVDYIVGKIKVGNDIFVAQGRTAKEFVEMVNDTLYAAYSIPLEYAERLGGDYRLTPSEEEFKKLNNSAVSSSNLNFGHVEVLA